ncbi:MAG: SET domain-containing protein-lysine N-methyltransferase [Chloroflexota bacterium]
MTEPNVSYLSPKLEARPLPEKGFYGVYSHQAVPAAELLVMWSGGLYSLENLGKLPPLDQSRSVQVEDDLFLVPIKQGEPADFINHSCNPNAGLNGQIALVAMRDIAAGEEICYDYAMSDGSAYDEFECQCGEAACRHRVTGHDWRLPELQQRYRGYFSPYLQRRIDHLKSAALTSGQSVGDV